MLKVANSIISASQIATPITFAGDVTLSTGNLVIGTSGKGIDFTATGQPGGMTSELLADYEEGTWTPVFGGASSTSGQSYGAQIGFYTKIGRQVFCSFQCEFSAEGTVTGNLRLTGLPFTQNGTTYGAGYLSQMSNLGSSCINGTIRIGGMTGVVFVTTVAGTSPTAEVDAATFLTDSTVLLGCLQYFV